LLVGCGSSDSPAAPGGPDGSTAEDGATPPDSAVTQNDGAVPPPPSDSGAPEASGTDSGDGAAPPVCSDTALLFCDDFESYAVGPAKGGKWMPGTASTKDALTIDTAHVRGTKSLHVHVDANEFAYIKLSGFNPPNNSFFGRVFVWVTAFPTAPPYAHFTLVETAGQPSSAGVIRPIGGQYDPQGNAADWGVGTDQGPTGDWTNWKSSAPAKAGAWLCLEWQMAAADNAINVWIDSVAKPELSVSTKNHGGNNVDFVFPTFQTIWFGWWLYQANPTPAQYDLWYDDVVLGTKRIGC